MAKTFNTNIAIGGTLSPSLQRAFNSVQKFANKSNSSFKSMNGSASKLQTTLRGLSTKALSLIGNMARMSIVALGNSINKLKAYAKSSVASAEKAATVNKKLETVAKAGSHATDEQVASLKSYASELSSIGVISGGTAKAGMTQLATFGITTDSIKKLTPEMLNLAVNQKGVNATSQDMMNYANMVGKAMQGNATAMTRVGVTMTKAQQNTIKTGTEQEKAATIVKVLNQNYGDLNETIAKTPEGRAKKIKNNWAAVKSTIGTQLLPVMAKLREVQYQISAFVVANLSPTIEKLKSVFSKCASIVETRFTPIVADLKAKFQSLWEKLEPVRNKLDQIKQNLQKTDYIGIFSSAIDKLGDAFDKVLEYVDSFAKGIKDAKKACSEHKVAVTALGIVLGTVALAILAYNAAAILSVIATNAAKLALVGFRIVATGAAIATTALSLATGAFGAVLAFLTSPITLVILVIGALIGIGYILYNNWGQISNFFVDIWQNKVLPFFEGVPDFFSGIWEGIKSGFKTVVNSVIEGINGITSAINSIKLPDWIPGIGGKGLKIPSIDKFAKGGLATETSICGEAGPEMVIPMKKNNSRSIKLLEKTNQYFGMNKQPAPVQQKASKIIKAETDEGLKQLEPLKPRKISLKSRTQSNSGSGNSYNITYNPVINTANKSKDEFKTILKNNFEDFKEFFENFMEDKERMSIDEPIFNI